MSWMALGMLALCVLVIGVVVLESAGSLARQYPEFAHLEGPFIGATIAFGICAEVGLVVTGLLIGAISAGRIFDRSALKLVDALVVTLILATAIVAAVLPFAPGPPLLELALLGSVLFGAPLVLVLLLLRSLLRQAASMSRELAEVV